MATKWPFSPLWWVIPVLWSLLAMGVGWVLLIAYRLRARYRGP